MIKASPAAFGHKIWSRLVPRKTSLQPPFPFSSPASLGLEAWVWEWRCSFPPFPCPASRPLPAPLRGPGALQGWGEWGGRACIPRPARTLEAVCFENAFAGFLDPAVTKTSHSDPHPLPEPPRLTGTHRIPSVCVGPLLKAHFLSTGTWHPCPLCARVPTAGGGQSPLSKANFKAQVGLWSAVTPGPPRLLESPPGPWARRGTPHSEHFLPRNVLSLSNVTSSPLRS